MIVILVVASHAGAVAAIRPARRAARMNMLQGFQSDGRSRPAGLLPPVGRPVVASKAS